MTAARQIEVRNLKFEMGREVPRFWHGGRPAVSTFFDNLSIFFPVGERFFIASVKAHVQFIKDPELAQQARDFYAQEGHHGREHMRYNDMLRRHGYPVDSMEGRVARLLSRVKRFVPKRLQLSATCALEHLTALMAHMILNHPDLMKDAHPEMAALWRWHAAEENEHKAVAFDIFKASGGTYPERVAAMVVATLIFWFKVAEQQARMMHANGTLWSLREWYSVVHFLFVEPGGMGETIPMYFDYYRPGFHPWQHDNQHLLDAWKEELANDPNYEQALSA